MFRERRFQLLRRLACGGAFALLLPAPAEARDLFELSGRVLTERPGLPPLVTEGRATDNNLLNFVERFNNAGLAGIFGNYTERSPTFTNADLRGVPARLSYPTSGTGLRLEVDGAGIDRTFTGATRDESQRLLLDWLKGEGQRELSRLLQFAVANTPVDPVAGNPNSLMANMAAADFAQGTGIGPLAMTPASPGGGGIRGSLGVRYASYSVGAFDQDAYVLPLAWRFDLENGDAILLDGPLTLSQTNGSAETYAGSVGLGYSWRVPLGLEDVAWSVTPAVRFGVVGSIDLGSAAGMYSVAVSSALRFGLDGVNPGLALTLGNMVGRLQTVSVGIDQYDISYRLQNWSYRNGLMLSQRIGEVFGRPAELSVYAIDTRFSGSSLYINAYQEYGAFVGLGTLSALGVTFPIRVGANVLVGEKEFNGFGLSAGFTF